MREKDEETGRSPKILGSNRASSSPASSVSGEFLGGDSGILGQEDYTRIILELQKKYHKRASSVPGELLEGDSGILGQELYARILEEQQKLQEGRGSRRSLGSTSESRTEISPESLRENLEPAEPRVPRDHKQYILYRQKARAYRAGLLRAAQEALNNAERDVESLEKRLGNSAIGDIESEDLSDEIKALSQTLLWESFLRDSKRLNNAEAWIAARDLSLQIEYLTSADTQYSSQDLRRAIESLRSQIDFVERHGLPVLFAQILYKAAKRLQWKIAAVLAAAFAVIAASGEPLTIQILLAALALKSADQVAEVVDEIRDQLTVRTREHTPQGRVYEVNRKLIDPINTLADCLYKRAQGEPLEKGESEVMRLGCLAAEFLALNARQRARDYLWAGRDEYMNALTEARTNLDDVLIMIASQDFGEAATVSKALKNTVKALTDNAPQASDT